MKGIKLVELYEQPTQRQTKDKWTLREVVVNPDYVVCLRPDARATVLLREGNLPDGLDARQEFTKIQMSQTRKPHQPTNNKQDTRKTEGTHTQTKNNNGHTQRKNKNAKRSKT